MADPLGETSGGFDASNAAERMPGTGVMAHAPIEFPTERSAAQTTPERINRVVLRGRIVGGPTLVHHRTSRVVLRMELAVGRGSASIAVSMWDPPADLALEAMTEGPGRVATVLGHLEYLIDISRDRPAELVVIGDELTLHEAPQS